MGYSITIEEIDNGTSGDVDRAAENYRTQIGLIGESLMKQNRTMQDFIELQTIDAKNYKTINENIRELHEARRGKNDRLTYGLMVHALRKTDQRVRVTNALSRIVDPLADRIELIELDSYERNLTMHRQVVFLLDRIRRNTEHANGFMQTMISRAQRFYTNMMDRPFETILNGILNTTLRTTASIGKLTLNTMKSALFGWRKEEKGFDKVTTAVNKLREYIATGQVDDRKTKWQSFTSGGLTGIAGRVAANAIGINVEKAQDAQKRKELGYTGKEDLSTKISSILFGGETLKRGTANGMFGQQINKEKKQYSLYLDGLKDLRRDFKPNTAESIKGKKETQSFFRRDPDKFQSLTLGAIQKGNNQDRLGFVLDRKKWQFEKRHIEKRDNMLVKIHHEMKASNKRLSHMSTLMSISALRGLFATIASWPIFKLLGRFGGKVKDLLLPKRLKNTPMSKIFDKFKKWAKPQFEHPIQSFKAKSMIGKAIPLVGSLATGVLEYFNSASDDPKATKLARGLVGGGTVVGHLVGGILGAFFGPVGAIGGGLIGGEIGKLIGEAAADIFTGSKFLGDFGKGVRAFYGDVKEWFSDAYDDASNYVTRQLKQARKWVHGRIDAGFNYIGDVKKRLMGTVDAIQDQIHGMYKSAVDSIGNGVDVVTGIKDRFIQKFIDIKTTVTNAISDYISSLSGGVVDFFTSMFSDDEEKTELSGQTRYNQRNRNPRKSATDTRTEHYTSWSDEIMKSPERRSRNVDPSIADRNVDTYGRSLEDIQIDNEKKGVTKDDILGVGSLEVDLQQLELLKSILNALTGPKNTPSETGPVVFRPEFMKSDMTRGGAW